MKIMIKILIAMMFMLGGSLVHASTKIEFVYYYPPGGGTDRYTAPLVESLTAQNVEVSRKFFKSCSEAVSYVNNNPEGRLIVASSDDMHPEKDNRCPSQKTSNLQWVSNIMSAPLYLCTVPSKSNLTLEDLLSGQQYNIGSLTSEIAWLPINAFVKYNKNDLNVRLVPYEGGGALRIAAMSGRDLDFVVTGNDAPVFMKEGANCIASTHKDNYLNLPHLGSYVKDIEFPNFSLDLSFWGINSLSSTQEDALIQAFNSETNTSFLKTREGVQHKGIASNLSKKEQYESVMLQIYALDFLRENK